MKCFKCKDSIFSKNKRIKVSITDYINFKNFVIEVQHSRNHTKRLGHCAFFISRISAPHFLDVKTKLIMCNSYYIFSHFFIFWIEVLK